MTTHLCETCAYYVPNKGPGADAGHCKRYPPISPSVVGVSPWPVVSPFDGCGEHSALQGFVVEGNPNHEGPVYLFRLLPK